VIGQHPSGGHNEVKPVGVKEGYFTLLRGCFSKTKEDLNQRKALGKPKPLQGGKPQEGKSSI
jgi:hypothetical protein